MYMCASDHPFCHEKLKSKSLFFFLILRVYFFEQVLEIRPLIEWDKGHALEYLLDTLGFSSSGVVPIYLGDDRTDEDAFKV